MNIMERLGTKIGPLPVWAWGGIGAVVVWFLVGRSGTPNPLVSTQESSDGGGGGGGAGPDRPAAAPTAGGAVGGGGGPPDPVSAPVAEPSFIVGGSTPDAWSYDMLNPRTVLSSDPASADPRNIFGGAPGYGAYGGPVDPFGFPMRTDPVVGPTPQPDLAPRPTPVYHAPDILPIPPEIQVPDSTGFSLPPNFTGTFQGIPYSNGQPIASLTAPSHSIDATAPTPNITGWTVYPVTTAPVNPNPGWVPKAIPLDRSPAAVGGGGDAATSISPT